MENLLTPHIWLLAIAIVAFFAVGRPRLAAAIATDDGTIENISSYPIDGNWGDDIHFVLVGDDSHAEGATDFKVVTP